MDHVRRSSALALEYRVLTCCGKHRSHCSSFILTLCQLHLERRRALHDLLALQRCRGSIARYALALEFRVLACCMQHRWNCGKLTLIVCQLHLERLRELLALQSCCSIARRSLLKLLVSVRQHRLN